MPESGEFSSSPQIKEVFGSGIPIIRRETQRRRYELSGSYSDEVRGWMSIYTGDYQRRVEEQYKNPVKISDEIAKYAENLLKRGVKRVNVVDFGAMAASTMCEVALQKEKLIKQGKLNIVATNIASKPTLADINWLKKHREHTAEHIENLEWVLKKKLVDFEQADIIELFQMMQGQPIHLMFIVDTIIWAPEYTDILLKAVSRMLDPRFGSLVLTPINETVGSSKVYSRDNKLGLDLYKDGIKYLETAGFRDIDQSLDRRLSRSRSPLVRFQAPESPNFPLEANKKRWPF